mgnify:CR=1 FL=1
MITAKDIKNKRFEKAAFGYKQEEIDEYMQQLEADFRAMEHDLEDANAKIQLLADKVREYRADEDALKDALLGAQKQGKHVIAEANEKAAEILQEAQARAEQLNDEATRQHEQAMAANRAEIDREKQALIVAQNQVADFKKSQYLKLMYVWGHSYEFDNGDGWERIEAFCKTVSGDSEIWYATNAEIFDYITALRALKLSADNKTVYNPSALTVWFTDGGREYSVGGGETLRIGQ